MLILTRRPITPGEALDPRSRIIIDGGIEITIMKVEGNHVQVGITAPRGVGVHREEQWIKQRGRDENE